MTYGKTSVSQPRMHIMGETTAIYDLDGNPVRQAALQDAWHTTLLVVPSTQRLPAQQDVEQAKATFRSQLIDALYEECVAAHQRPMRVVHLTTSKSLTGLEAELRRLPKPTSEEAYRLAIGTWVDKKYKAFTTERIRADIQANAFECSGNGKTRFARTPLEKDVKASLARLPEWLQVLSLDQGIYVATDASARTMHRAAGSAPIISNTYLPFLIFIHPEIYAEVDNGKRDHILREELLHAVHMHAQARSIPEKMFDGGSDSNDLHDRWGNAALKLAVAMGNNAQHPAWQLITKTEPGGGSLLRTIREQNPFEVPLEMLIDIIDAEYYLRQKNQCTPQACEKKLRGAFGDELYDLSRQYIEQWIEEAAHVIEKRESRGAAAKCLKKWQGDPLCHAVDDKYIATLIPQGNGKSFP